jgi:PTH1 family peptidyl-tRNA hydrolase
MRDYMTAIMGLGNPGKKYSNTRHNVGFMVVDELAKENLEGFILAKSETFMNLSGRAVKKIIKNYKLQSQNLIIIHDDIDIPIGEFKIQKGRGAAGHKGVQSIIKELTSKDFWRVRIGVCPQRGKPKNIERFVLQSFTKEEKNILKKNIPHIIDLLKSDSNKRNKPR